MKTEISLLNRAILASILIGTALISNAAESNDVIGKLGRVRTKATIFSRPSSKARAYYHAKSDEFLVLRSVDRKGWIGVVMSNMSVGYIKSDDVERLAYDVTRDRTQTPPPIQGLATTSGGRNSLNAIAAQYGLRYIGKVQYKWGGESLSNGIDCSGFVKKMFGAIGVNLPRTAAEQALVGTPISRLEELQAGDRLYFWDRKRGKIGHTGIYIGGGQFVHSSSGHHGVQTDHLSARWTKILVAARRS